MPTANVTQVQFLGGEASPWSQGRLDQAAYRQSMNLCLNGYPVEEGPWTRRPGFIDGGYTHLGRNGALRPFVASTTQGTQVTLQGVASVVGVSTTYLVEITGKADGTDGNVRLWIPQPNGYPTLLREASPPLIVSFSGATPTLMTVGVAQDWATGDTAFIVVESGTTSNAATIVGRQLLLTKVSTTTFTLADAITNAAIDGSTITYATNTARAHKIVVLPTKAYLDSAGIINVRLFQSGDYALALDKAYSPQLLTLTPDLAVSLEDANFKEADGPYLDPLLGTSQTNNKTATATTSDGLTYHITIGSDGSAYAFVATDVERCFRVWTQPPEWDSATSYNTLDTVTYNGAYYTALPQLGATTITAGVAPGKADAVGGVPTFPWALTPTLGRWTAGYISAYTSPTQIDMRVCFFEPAYALLRLVIDTWQIGLFRPGETAGSPTLGNPGPISATWAMGRLWLGGRRGSFDASMSNRFKSFVSRDTPLFSPTGVNGEVFDDAAITYPLDAKDSLEVLWMTPDRQGVVMATARSDWLVSAATQGDTLTPTSIEAKQVGRYKAAFVEPLRVGSVLIFVQSFLRKVYEYLVDAFSGRFTARPGNANAEHLPDRGGGIVEMCYQEDPVPIIWAITFDGTLLGCTYRRISDFATAPPEFMGWHQHSHGAGRLFISICTGTVVDGQDALAALTYDTVQQAHHVEFAARVSAAASGSLVDLDRAIYLDGAMIPGQGVLRGVGNQPTLFFSIQPAQSGSSLNIATFAVTSTDPDFVGDVTISLASGPSATLSGTLTQTAVAGTATFDDVASDIGGADFVFAADADTYATVNSAPFSIGTRAVNFDGAATAVYRAVALAGVSDSGTYLISFWFRSPVVDASPHMDFLSLVPLNGSNLPATLGTVDFYISTFNGTDRLDTYLDDQAGNIWERAETAAPGRFADAAWHHVLMSGDVNHATGARIGQLVVDGDLRTTAFGIDSGIAFLAKWTAPGISVGFSGFTATTVVAQQEVDMAEVYMNFATSLDLSDAANVAKFRNAGTGKPVSLGATGSTPTGVAPAVYLGVAAGGAASTFATNKGTGGNFTISGSLVLASTDPF